jgi:hypothetical protein
MASHQSKDVFILELDGKFESEYGTFTRALKAGLELKQKFPKSQIKVHDAIEQIPTDEQSANEALLN